MATIPADVRQWDVRTPGVDVESAPLPAPHAGRSMSNFSTVRPRTGTAALLLVPLDAASPSAAERARSTTARSMTARSTTATAPRATAASVVAAISTVGAHVPDGVAAKALVARARALWPGLLPRQLANTRGDPRRIVRLAARRSNEAPEVLMRMLLGGRSDSNRR